MSKSDPMTAYYSRRYETIKLQRPPADGRERVVRPSPNKTGYEWVEIEELLASYLAEKGLKVVSASEKAPDEGESPESEGEKAPDEGKSPESEGEKAPRRTRKTVE